MADIWDAGQYLRFGGERSRPFFDLIAQVGATDPGTWPTSAAVQATSRRRSRSAGRARRSSGWTTRRR